MPSERVTINRLPERSVFDRDLIDSIIDEALICHVGFTDTAGRPVVIPTIHARAGDLLYFHGSPASRMLRTMSEGVPVCVTITHVDGIVVARAPFHMSTNYRSVVIFGEAARVRDADEKWEAVRVITEHVTPGRWDDARLPSRSEMNQTSVLSLRIDEVSAKVRTGPPGDDDEDYDLDHWAGVIPLRTIAGDLVDDPRLKPGIAPPDYLIEYTRHRD